MDNSWKQKSLTPQLISKESPSYNTVKDLQNALADEKKLNIAITGPYGSGKSSVLATLMDNAPKDKKFLDISLATLDADESLNEGKVRTKQGRQSINNNHEILNRKIEYSILQQLVYRETLDKLPFSRLKKIRHLSTHTINVISCYLLGFIIAFGLSFKPSMVLADRFYELINFPENLQSAISQIAIIFLFIMSYEIISKIIQTFGGLRPQHVNVGGNEIKMNDEGSIFNRYLDEILYFFQCTDYNVVIIEDLDRFNSPDIFLKLRELNHIINKSKIVGRVVQFIYAVKDDMFKDSSRTKFFDYITTVIPIITSSNSKDILKKTLNELGHKGEISDEDIKNIAFHINDMRLLYNIVNEYDQYTKRLFNEEHPLDHSKMLAMMTLKNYHPHDFSDLHNRKGKLYEALSPKAKRKYIDFAINTSIVEREELAKKDLEEYESSCYLSSRELRLSYIVALISKIPHENPTIIINDKGYKCHSIANNENLFNTIIKGTSIKYTYQDRSYRGYSEDRYLFNFSDIEKEVNPKYTYNQRISQIGTDMNRLLADINEIELEKKQVYAYRIHELIDKFNIYEEGFFKALKLSDLEEDFIRLGLVAEDYNDYISYFYPEIMSASDHQLCLDMKLNRITDFDARIDNVELLIQELPLSVFRHESVWNIYILDYLMDNSMKYKNHYDLVVDSLREKRSSYFLYQYYKYSDKAVKVFTDCMAYHSSDMWNKIETADNQEKNILLKLWFLTCNLADIKSTQETWIDRNYDFVASVYEDLPNEKKDYFTNECCYEALSLSDNQILKNIVDNGCYMLNDHNVPIIVAVKQAQEDISKLEDLEEMQYAINLDIIDPTWHNLYEYYKKNTNQIDDVLLKYVSDHISNLTNETVYIEEKYRPLLQSLLEIDKLSDSNYRKICETIEFEVEATSNVFNLSQAKLQILIETKSFSYDPSILRSLNDLSVNLSCAYIYVYRDHLSEILLSRIMSTPLAEALLYHPGFNQVEYNKIIASLEPSSVSMNRQIGNKICALMSIQYSVCDESILFDAIRLCSDIEHAVLTAVQKIVQSEYSHAIINDLLGILPTQYLGLTGHSNQPKKFELNRSNLLLIEALKKANYISSFSTENGKIKVYTKRK